jgi:hypothetical protein
MFNLLLKKNHKSRDSGDLPPLKIALQMDSTEAVLSSGNYRIRFSSSHPWSASRQKADFAVWAFLPLAMRLGRDLQIEGAGDELTAHNAEKLSDIWSCWLPHLYLPVNVRFAEASAQRIANEPEASLMLYSGGIDSTYSLIANDWQVKPDLLTVQGMDYQYLDDVGFANAARKTSVLTDHYAARRIFIKSDAYATYTATKLNVRLTFPFVLAASGFLFSENYRELLIAADFSLHQQFMAFPYGSNSATNPFFASSGFKMMTHGDDVTRAEKLIPISRTPAALASISLCKDKKIRPENCGLCIKCLRTKHMFLAATGGIPENCFLDSGIDPRKKLKFSKRKRAHDSFVCATYNLAFRTGNLDKIPGVVSEYANLQSSH